jgi:hypothetical protein
MLGWYLDVLIEYLFRALIRVVRLMRSKSWPITKAKLLNVECPPAPYGCTVVVLTFEYCVADRKYSGIHKKPFLFTTSGEIYVSDLKKVQDLRVRVDPQDPSIAVFHDISIR